MTIAYYFGTPVGPEYKKKFTRNVGIAVLILFAFYGIWSLATQVSEPENPRTFQNGKECNSDSGVPDYECFIESFEKCQSATISITRNTIEGDPVFFTGIVISKDDSCHLDFAIDSTQDRFGSEGITHRICSDVYFEDGFFTFECDDGKFGIPLE